VHVLGDAGSAVPKPGRFVLPLLEHRRESPSAMTFRFSTEGTGFRYLSNQAIRLTLPGLDDPWGPVRTFSLSSSPSEEGQISVTCKISDTVFKQALARMAPGDQAEVYGPLGLFLFDEKRPSVFRGMLRYAVDTGNRTERRLLYSARVPEEFVFRDELSSLASGASTLRVGYTITRPTESTAAWDGRVGRITPAWIQGTAAGLDRPKYYVAGLPEMVDEIVTALGGPLGVPEDDIDYEVFRGF